MTEAYFLFILFAVNVIVIFFLMIHAFRVGVRYGMDKALNKISGELIDLEKLLSIVRQQREDSKASEN